MAALMFWRKKEEEKKRDSRFKEFKVDDEGFPIISYKQKQRMKEKSMLINYPVGSDVITKSNEDEPYQRGTLVNYMALTQAANLTPMVRYGDGETFVVMGIIRHYSKELCNALDKLNNIEQWNVLAEYHKIKDKEQ